MASPVLPEDSAPPNTTAEQNLVTAGQRHINVMWERTQQVIAVMVAAVTLFACVFLVIYGELPDKTLAFSFLQTISIMVIATYFQRTNHVKTGGVPATTSDR